jgi:hypothetical protein
MKWNQACWLPVVFIAVVALPALAAVDGTPEQAVLDVVTATKPEAVEKHLPVVTVDAIRHLTPADRQAAEHAILVGEKFRQQGLEPRMSDDGSALLEFWRRGAGEDIPTPEMKANLVREIVGGRDALLELSLESVRHGSHKLLVWMRLEEGEWRVTELQPGGYGDGTILDQPAFVEQFRRSQEKEIEAQVLATLRTLNTALVSYAATYPDIGLPETLAALAPPEEGDDPTAERAGLLGLEVAAQPYVSAGYVFSYQLLADGSGSSYSIIAGPADHGKSGSRRFYTDESGAICSTSEDRDPTADDDPVE